MKTLSDHGPQTQRLSRSGAEKNEQIMRGKKRVRKRECEGGRKVLLKQLVNAETAATPLPSSKANWLSSLTPHAQASRSSPPPHTQIICVWLLSYNKYHKETYIVHWGLEFW